MPAWLLLDQAQDGSTFLKCTTPVPRGRLYTVKRPKPAGVSFEFASFREQLDRGGPLSRAMVVIISAIAELERNLIVERVKAGLRRAKLEGRRIGRLSPGFDQEALGRDRERGLGLTELAELHHVSKSTVGRALNEARGVPKPLVADSGARRSPIPISSRSLLAPGRNPDRDHFGEISTGRRTLDDIAGNRVPLESGGTHTEH
ncbi:MAG: hypothetical protein DMG25_05160 [Acidobacteria bacterium]|nr:MAG: hypothetical protein DMG25_05160 [Acidobacteriota bacterium]PYV20779.1 MAG: hypothetical protein DMG27_22190 [Acidobacteriota bacterium]